MDALIDSAIGQIVAIVVIGLIVYCAAKYAEGYWGF